MVGLSRTPSKASKKTALDVDAQEADWTALANALELVGNKWVIIIVTLLGERTMRFAELRRAIGCVSARSLTQSLRKLVAAGLVSRTHHAEVPPRVEYALTPFGRSLVEPVSHLLEWAGEHHLEVSSPARPRK